MTGRRIWVLSVGVALGIMLSNVSQAQQRGNPQTKAVADFSGVLFQMNGNMMYLTDDKEAPIAIVRLSPQAKTSMNGTADRDFLTKNINVQFSAMVSPKDKKVQGEIKELQVCEITNEFPPGLTPEGGPDAVLAFQQNPDQPVKCLVRGTIRNGKDGDIQVAAGKDLVTATVAENAKITVAIANIGFARKGDKVKIVSGQEVVQQQPRQQQGQGGGQQQQQAALPKQIMADRIEITAATPLTDPKKKP